MGASLKSSLIVLMCVASTGFINASGQNLGASGADVRVAGVARVEAAPAEAGWAPPLPSPALAATTTYGANGYGGQEYPQPSFPVTFIVVTAPGHLDASDDDLDFLMGNLVSDFEQAGATFHLANVVRIINEAWAASCQASTGDIYQAHVPSSQPGLYVLLCETKAGIEGYHSPQWWQVVTVGLHTLPSNAVYPKKHVLTHEFGHLFGLRHTFVERCEDAAAANAGGYFMPAQLKVFDCSEGQDSCPDQPGLDFVTGFMSYCQDEIKSAFSREEIEWMWWTWRNDPALAELFSMAVSGSI